MKGKTYPEKSRSSRPQAVLSRRLAVSGLFELLKLKPYSDITISDICEQGGISRQTFYRNFTCKEEIVQYYIHHLMRCFIDQAEGIMEKDLYAFFLSMPLTPELLTLLRRNHLMYLLRDSMLDLIALFMQTDRYRAHLSLEGYRSYHAAFLADTLISILDTWADRDFTDSTEDLYQIVLLFLAGSVRT